MNDGFDNIDRLFITLFFIWLFVSLTLFAPPAGSSPDNPAYCIPAETVDETF